MTGGGSRKRRGGGEIKKKIIYTNNTCTYFVIQVATSPCTAVNPEVDYPGAALQHLLHKVKKHKTMLRNIRHILSVVQNGSLFSPVLKVYLWQQF